MSDVEALLTAVSEDQPAGPDLSDSSSRLAIESNFERSFDDSGEDAAEASWSSVIRDIKAQLAETKDIWLPVYLMRAGARAGRLDIIGEGAAILAGLVEHYWDSMHPSLEEWGLQSRITPCLSLSKIADFLGPLRRTVLIAHPRLGSYSGADFERFEQNGDAEADFGQFLAAMNDIDRGELVSALATVEQIKADLRRADAGFMERANGEGPNFEATYAALDGLRRSVASYAGGGDVEDEAGSDEPGIPDGGTGSESPVGNWSAGRIENRDDVLRALDSIADYYRRKEPSSPVPVALLRARQWVTLDFLSILDDISPGSIEDAKRVLVFGRE